MVQSTNELVHSFFVDREDFVPQQCRKNDGERRSGIMRVKPERFESPSIAHIDRRNIRR